MRPRKQIIQKLRRHHLAYMACHRSQFLKQLTTNTNKLCIFTKVSSLSSIKLIFARSLAQYLYQKIQYKFWTSCRWNLSLQKSALSLHTISYVRLLKLSRRRESKEKQKLDMLPGYKWKRLIVTVNVCNRVNVYFRSRFLLSARTIFTKILSMWILTKHNFSEYHIGGRQQQEESLLLLTQPISEALNFNSEVLVAYAGARLSFFLATKWPISWHDQTRKKLQFSTR